MNSQRGKASTQASKTVTVTKTQTNGNSRSRRKAKRNQGSYLATSSSSSPSQGVSYAPAASARRMVTSQPRISNSGTSTTITHREFFYAVVGSVLFSGETSYCNPGDSSMFPWLSSQARAYQTYKFNKLEFHYLPRCGSSTPGSVAMAFNWNASATHPGDESEILAVSGCVEDAPWVENRLRVPNRFKELAIRYQSLPYGTDRKTYDSGFLSVGKVDGTAVGWGKIWVDYSVTLSSPVQPEIPHVGCVSTFGLAHIAISSAALFAGNAREFTDDGEDGIAMSTQNPAASSVMYCSGFDIGTDYMLILTIEGTTCVTCGNSLSVPAVTIIGNGETNGPLINGAATVMSTNLRFKATSINHEFTFTSTAATVTNTSLRIVSIDDPFN